MAEEKRAESVVSTPAKTKKKSEARKLADVFVAEDAKNVGSYMWLDVVVPSVKKMLADLVSDGINMLLFGGTGRSKSETRNSANYVSYRSYSDKRDDRHSYSESRSRNRFDYDDIIFPNRAEAEKVLDGLDAIIDKYGVARVGDLYDLADITAPYTSYNYGWTSMRNAEVARVRDGYVIKLSRAVPID